MRISISNRQVKTKTTTLDDAIGIRTDVLNTSRNGRVYSIQPMSINPDNRLYYDVPSNFESGLLNYNYFPTHGYYMPVDAGVQRNGSAVLQDLASDYSFFSFWGWDKLSEWSGDVEESANDNIRSLVSVIDMTLSDDRPNFEEAPSKVPGYISGSRTEDYISGSRTEYTFDLSYDLQGQSFDKIRFFVPRSFEQVNFKVDEVTPHVWNSLSYRWGHFNLSTADLMPMNILNGNISGFDNSMAPQNGGNDISSFRRIPGITRYSITEDNQPTDEIGGTPIRYFNHSFSDGQDGSLWRLIYIPTAFAHTYRF